MDKETKWITVLAIVFIAALCLGMFFLGRKSVHLPEPGIKSDTVWIELPEVHDTIKTPSVLVYVPADTVYYPVPQPTDTAALFAVWLDYYATREYELDFSSDSTGVFKVNAKVNQNQLQEAVSTIQPRVKVITNTETYYKTRLVQPWVMVGTSVIDLKFQQIQAGVDLKEHWMVGVGGIRYDKNFNLTVNVGYKF